MLETLIRRVRDADRQAAFWAGKAQAYSEMLEMYTDGGHQSTASDHPGEAGRPAGQNARLEMEVKGLAEKMAPLADVKERVVKLEQCMPAEHKEKHTAIENKLVQHQGNWQWMINTGSVLINGVLAWLVSQGLR